MWLGLGAALAWGISDYLAQPATRSLGTVRAVFYGQLAGLVLLFPYVLFSQAHFFPSNAEQWMWIMITAALATGGGLAFYQSAKLGNLAVVAPIMGSYGAVTTLLAWLWGQHLTALVASGLGLALVSVILVSLPPRQARMNVTSAQVQGVMWAVTSAFVIGACFFVMGQELTPRLGGTLTTFWTRVVGLLINLVIIQFTRQSLRVPSLGQLVTPGLTGTLSTGAILLTALGLGRGEDAIVTVLGSLSIVITTLIALLIVRERLAWWQVAGVLLAGVSVVMIGLK